MECLNNEFLISWLNEYGSIALLVLLALGIIALPIPDETLIVLAGAFIRAEHLNFFPTALAAYLGAMIGISVSYLIGYGCGHFIIHKYGRWVGLTEAKFNKAHSWYEKYGVWTLLFGYFIPGVRHFTGIIAGSVEVKYKHFALFAYTGAFLWASLFLSIGYFFGSLCIPLNS